jgi:hypothetical protein
VDHAVTMRSAYERINAGDIAGFGDLVADDFVEHQGGQVFPPRYGVLEDPDGLVEITDWESAEAREAHLRQTAATGAYAPLLELLAALLKVTVISQLP